MGADIGKIRETLLCLVRESLRGGSSTQMGISLSEQEWYDLYAMAKSHTVQGIVFDAVKSLPPGSGLPATLAAKWLFDVRRIEKSYYHISGLIERQAAVWEKAGIDVVLLKGHTVAVMYPVPEHRVNGDIDWQILSGNGWDKAIALLDRNGVRYETDSDGDVHFMADGVVTELHRSGIRHDLLTSGNRIAGILLMLNAHILKHAMVFGVGLRQLCDMAVAYSHYAGRYDAGAYGRELENEGLSRWTALLHSFLVGTLGLPPEYLPFVSSERIPDRDLSFFTEMVFADGNFGTSRDGRLSGMPRRLGFYLRYAPGNLSGRWISLVRGRMRKFCAHSNGKSR